MKITIVFMTGRRDPHLEWLLADLVAQRRADDFIDLIVVDVFGRGVPELISTDDVNGFVNGFYSGKIRVVSPKPNPWQGKHRVTSVEWWATSNSRNTALLHANTDYVVFIDDRSHLGPKWLDAVRTGFHERQSVLAGAYTKLEGTPPDTRVSTDHRLGLCPNGNINCGGGWLYGCTIALPLAWALEVNGFEEGCDGLTGEDYIFGLMLGNNGRRIDYVPDLFVHQDRTTGNESCKGSYKCMDKGVSPNDKSHAALERFGKRKKTEFTYDLTAMRETMHAHPDWPLPVLHTPDIADWYDGELIREM